MGHQKYAAGCWELGPEDTIKSLKGSSVALGVPGEPCECSIEGTVLSLSPCVVYYCCVRKNVAPSRASGRVVILHLFLQAPFMVPFGKTEGGERLMRETTELSLDTAPDLALPGENEEVSEWGVIIAERT